MFDQRFIYSSRLSFQVPIALIVAIALPYFLRNQVGDPLDQSILGNTVFASSLAILVGAFLMRSVSTYPGAEKSSSALPAMTASYGILLTIFVFARIPYSRTILFFSYVLSALWFLTISLLTARRRSLRIGYLPIGDLQAFRRQLPNITWLKLETPEDPIDGLDAVTADLRIDIPSAWDRRLADFALMQLPVYHTKNLVESLTGTVQLEHLSENSFGSLAPRQDYALIKSIVDRVGALFLIIVLLPALLIVALLICMTSKGPALFRQRRIGYLGQPFEVIKFRTMHIASSDDTARDAAITKEGDNRITGLGQILRRTRIDELPQLINVTRGEMSFIGPRPEAAVLSEWYENEIPFYRYRHIVKPGITGWAQVMQGHVANVEAVRSKLHYDFYYIKHYSFWMDLVIIVKTITTILTGFGSK